MHAVSRELGVSWAALKRWCVELEAEGVQPGASPQEELSLLSRASLARAVRSPSTSPKQPSPDLAIGARQRWEVERGTSLCLHPITAHLPSCSK